MHHKLPLLDNLPERSLIVNHSALVNELNLLVLLLYLCPEGFSFDVANGLAQNHEAGERCYSLSIVDEFECYGGATLHLRMVLFFFITVRSGLQVKLRLMPQRLVK